MPVLLLVPIRLGASRIGNYGSRLPETPLLSTERTPEGSARTCTEFALYFEPEVGAGAAAVEFDMFDIN